MMTYVIISLIWRTMSMVKAIHNNVVLEKKDTKQVNGIYIPNAKSEILGSSYPIL